MVTVTTTATAQQVDGTTWTIDGNGYLTVEDDAGNSIASFTPGVWKSVEVVPS